MTRIFYEDGRREDEQPPQHHDPPLGWKYVATYHTIDSDGNSKTGSVTCDCYLPFDGSNLVLCDAHKEMSDG